jgi:hypothetical protein
LLLAATLDRVAQDLRNRVEFASGQTGGQPGKGSHEISTPSLSEKPVLLIQLEFVGKSFGSLSPCRRDHTARAL